MTRRLAKVFVLAVTVGLLVFLGQSAMLASWRGRFSSTLVPILSWASRGAEKAHTWLGGASGEKLRELEGERERLLGEVARRDEVMRENETLREALALRKEGEEGVIPAKIVGFFRQGRDEFLLLDRGAENGIAPGDLVLNKNRVLGGAVVEAGSGFARVMLLTSPSKGTDVIAGNDLRVIAKGNNNRELIIDLVPQDAGIKSGDLVTASPRATGRKITLVVGEIREVRQAENEVFKTVRALHLFNPADGNVLVLLAP